LVEALLYKPEGRGFHSRWVIEIFNLINPTGLPMALWPTQPVTEMSITDISWGKGGRCVGLTDLPLSCADILEILGASFSWKLEVLSNLVMGLLCLLQCTCSTVGLIKWHVSECPL
jgi:hypothetical protein